MSILIIREHTYIVLVVAKIVNFDVVLQIVNRVGEEIGEFDL